MSPYGRQLKQEKECKLMHIEPTRKAAIDRLEAHHSYYKRGKYALWEYPLDSFRCLCRSCHEKRHKEEIRMRSFLSGFATDDMEQLRLALSSAIHWHSISDFLILLKSLRLEDKDLIEQLLERRKIKAI